jgi:UDP-GlcNAc:undecaprenyl-phosphate GlcNAc-1-phosphate transferase
MQSTFFFTLVFASLVTFFCAFPLKKFAFKWGIIDEPGKRKIHKKPIPLLGGLSIYFGFILAILINPNLLAHYWVTIAAATVILLINMLDDINELPAKTRFITEFIVAAIIIAGGGRIDFLPNNLLGDSIEILLTLIWILGITNAFNYLDGLDGLATGSAIINFTFFSIILIITGQQDLSLLCAILAISCAAFLPHNFRKAEMFLGDSGSTFLGFLLAVIPLEGSWAQDSIVKISIPILILGVPIFDMFFTTIMRIRDGKVKTFSEWLKYAGKDHFHHALVYVGLSPFKAVLFIWATTFSLGLSALLVANTLAWKGIITVLQALIIFLMIGVLIVVGRKHQSGWGKE